MDRSLQSGLEKRTRVGAWQSRVYRLERGYLSAWPDVVSAAAKEQPSRTECLFQDDQVATVTDQGVCVHMMEVNPGFVFGRRSCAGCTQLGSSVASCFPLGLVRVQYRMNILCTHFVRYSRYVPTGTTGIALRQHVLLHNSNSRT